MREREMGGPVRPPWGELDAVVRRVVSEGGDADDVRAAALDVALEEGLDERRAEERALALYREEEDL